MPAPTWDEIKRQWFLDLPRDLNPERVVAGFTAARRYLGNDWPEKFARKSRGYPIAVQIMTAGLILKMLDGIAGFQPLVEKIRRDFLAGMSEATILAALRRVGVEPHLNPDVDGKRPDACARWDGESIYLEIARPVSGKAEKDLRQFLLSLANAVIECLPEPLHVEIALAGASDEAKQLVLTEVERMLKEKKDESHISNVAHIFISNLETHRVGDYAPPWKGYGAKAQMVQGRLDQPSPGVLRRRQVKTQLWLSDDRAASVLSRERKHLSRANVNVVILNVSQVAVGLSLWPALIRKQFRPNQNTRIGAVVLLSETLTSNGMTADVLTIANLHARLPVPVGFLKTLEMGIRRLFAG